MGDVQLLDQHQVVARSRLTSTVRENCLRLKKNPKIPAPTENDSDKVTVEGIEIERSQHIGQGKSLDTAS